MRRLVHTPRIDWRVKVEAVGLTYHSHDSGLYWDESVCYELLSSEVDELEAAANTLHELCLEAAGMVIERGWWDRLGILPLAVPTIVESWNRDDFSLYGRFDLAYDGKSPPKLLEYNADTPTALVEAAVAQWFWLEETYPKADQFNSIHERLIAAWKRFDARRVTFASLAQVAEDEQTVRYLRDTCHQAGHLTGELALEEVGWEAARECFVDLSDEPVEACFKLYPWEWMWAEEFGRHLPHSSTRFVEPPWKMLLSNKGLLPILHELFPNHPNLLPAYDSPDPLGTSYVQKPRLGREGANVTLVQEGRVLCANEGPYGAEGFVFQALAPAADFDGQRPVCGVWMVAQEAAGLGIREDHRPVTGNLSRFVPHVLVDGLPG